MNINLPELALVVLIGPSGSGKSTFAQTHFLPTEVVSSDFCRGLVSDDENDQSATKDAFDLLHTIAGKRLQNGRLTVVDATNVKAADRKPLVELARRHHVLPVAIVLNLPEKVCRARNEQRPDRQFGSRVIRSHIREMKRSLKRLKREGFRRVFVLRSEEDVAQLSISREPLWNNRKELHGPFDIIGDVHGCATELEQLLEKLGYEWTAVTNPSFPATYHRLYHHPDGRTAIFLGDLVDRGPRNLDAYQLARHMVTAGYALCIPGNHDVKLMRKLHGRNVKVRYGLGTTLAEIETLPEESRDAFSKETADWIHSLVSHYVLDDGKLVVAHAGLKEELQGRASGRVREFALYGDTTGETDEFGLPVRNNWALDYRARAAVVYGHTPTPEAEWLNNTVNIDTGCVFGGQLTALRYPERELVSVPAIETYVEPIRPLRPELSSLTAQQAHDDLLDIADVTGKRLLETHLLRNIIIPAENSSAALEVMSRFAVNPKWLIYLPPTMSPPKTSGEPDLLEHPAQAFDYYRKIGVTQLVCEEKHMGSRAVAIVAKDETAVQQRFGIVGEGIGIIYTRTGRRFFDNV
ncbi:MAG: polynucleotide kinase-phosphatase, partial [Chloroflexi bacterium]|nr:polynucleotide kinase-phosphatase [Chloroflexota bacterium]